MSVQRRPLDHPRDTIMRTMDRIYHYRMTTTSGGNLSILDDSGDVWITPARVDKGSLTRRDIVCVNADGEIDGLHPPSSEYPFHRAIYQARPDLRAVVHAHPVALVAFSACGQTPDTRLFHQARNVCGEVALAKYALPGSVELGESIAECFAAGQSSVVLENHGVVVGGETLAEAYQQFEALEFAAKTLIKANQLGPVQYLNDEQLSGAQHQAIELPTFTPGPATAHERELRQQLSEFVHRGCRQRLLISTEGSYSARIDDDAFVITPTSQDRESLSIEDMVLVDGGATEAGKRPSRIAHAHRAIYRQHPDVGAIAFAHPVNATAFSVTGAPLDARTIPESYVFLREVQTLPFGEQHRTDGRLATQISLAKPAAILQNDGVVVVGKTVLDAFDRLEVLETTAEAIINTKPIGAVTPMSDAVIAELREAFGL
ncbi:MAG: class II aldolase/adducin family protein [Planctomycetota bacterium]